MNAPTASAAGPVELRAGEIELAVAAAEIESAKMLFDLEIGRTESRRPLVGKHRAVEMVAALKRREASRRAVLGVGRNVVAELVLVQEMISRRLADIGIAVARRQRDAVTVVPDIRHTTEQAVPILLLEFADISGAADLRSEGRARRALFEPARRPIDLQQRIAGELRRPAKRACELDLGQPNHREIVVDDVLHAEF